MGEKVSTKAIGVNGVAMTKENILNQTYPYCTEIYAAVRSDIDKESNAYQIFEFLTAPAAKTSLKKAATSPLAQPSESPQSARN